MGFLGLGAILPANHFLFQIANSLLLVKPSLTTS
jgi:hypothetical protein